jgi:pyruvate/2-oxoacid:ferredoxin oxidoreductase alpha subunit
VPEQALVDEFLPKRDARLKLDTADPRAFNSLVRPEDYMEMRWDQQEAMATARRMFDEIDGDWGVLTGRRWGAIEGYHSADAELLLVTSGTITSTARDVIDRRRDDGEKVGLVKVKMFRPFPTIAIRHALRSARRVAVLDRNISPGHGGIFAEEIRSALYDVPLDDRPWLHGYVLGLGGRDVTPATIDEIIDRTWAVDAPPREDLWVGVKP